MIPLRPLGLLCLATLLAACEEGPTHGEIVGDAYLALYMGSEVSLAGIPVRLVAEPDRDTANLDTTLANICVQRDRFLAQLVGDTAGSGRGADSLRALVVDASERAWRARDRLLQPLVRRTVRADDQARFVIPDVEPGDYRLWSDTVVDEHRWSWLQRVEIEAGDSVRVNLSNANADENPFRCKPPE